MPTIGCSRAEQEIHRCFACDHKLLKYEGICCLQDHSKWAITHAAGGVNTKEAASSSLAALRHLLNGDAPEKGLAGGAVQVLCMGDINRAGGAATARAVAPSASPIILLSGAPSLALLQRFGECGEL